MKLKNLVNEITQPFVSVDYYLNSVKKTFLASFTAFFLTIIITGLFYSGYFYKTTIRTIVPTVITSLEELKQNYPDELEIHWDNNKLIANQDNITVSWPQTIKQDFPEFPQKLLYFSNNQLTPTQLKIRTLDYMFYLNQDQLYFPSETDITIWDSYSLKDLFNEASSFSINKETVVKVSNQTIKFLESYHKLITITLFIALLFLFIIKQLIFFIFSTIFVLFIFKLNTTKLTSNQVAKLSMHVMIPTLVLDTLATLIYQDLFIPLKTITFWTLIIIIKIRMAQLKKNKI